MQKELSRLLAMILCVMMFVSLVPTTAFADDPVSETQPTAVDVDTAEDTAIVDYVNALLSQESKDAFNKFLEGLNDTQFAKVYGLFVAEENFETFKAAMNETQAARASEIIVAGENNQTLDEGENGKDPGEKNDGELLMMPFFTEALGSLASTTFVPSTHQVFKHTEYTMAPGIEGYTNYVYTNDGKQNVYFVTIADVTRSDVVVQTSYFHQYDDEKMGMSKLSDQIAYANAKYTNEEDPDFISPYYNVVAGSNASFYNMSTGQPMGVTYIDGKFIGEGSYDNFFAILKDGSAVVDWRSNLGNYTGEQAIVQACGGSQWIVRDGADVTGNASESYNTDRHCRTAVGVTADGKVVMMVLDGRQEPYSIGGSMHEIAQIMLEAGCVAAINLDGGGSTTYVAKLEGADKVSLVNKPSDGSERSISSGLIIATTAAPSNVFDHVTMSADNLYVMPGASTNVAIKGVSPAGTAAEIPANIVYECDNGSLVDGVFTAGETAKDTVITAKVDGTAVGSITIHVVIPTEMNFAGPQVAAPYGKSVTVKLNPKYLEANGIKYTVSYAPANIGFNVQDGYGTMNGVVFTATADTSVTATGAITAYLVADSSISATVPLKVGKESEVLFNFEEGVDGWGLYDYYDKDNAYQYTTHPSLWLADAETGEVRNGEHSMAIHLNFADRINNGGYDNVGVTYNKDKMKINTTDGCIDITGATNIGFWMYLPEGVDAMTIVPRVFFGAYDGNKWTRGNVMGLTLGQTDPDKYKEGGWFYFDFDISEYSGYKQLVLASMSSDKPATFGTFIELYNCDDLWKAGKMKNVLPDLTVYIDDYSVDYSTVKPDRNGPEFSSVVYANTQMADAVELRGQISPDNCISFTAKVSDYEEDNAVGLNEASASATIDGVNWTCTYDSGAIVIDGAVLPDGVHTVKFYMEDLNGNSTTVTRNIVINTQSSDSRAYVKAKDTSITKIKAGSLYYVDVVSTDIAATKAIDVTLKVTSTNTWAPQGIVAAKGFTFTYDYDDVDQTLTIHAEKTGTVEATGEATVLSVPVRAWYYQGTAAKYPTAQSLWNGGFLMPIDVQVFSKYGVVTFDDNSTNVFAADIKCDHEIDGVKADTTLTSCWHVHDAQPVEDKAPTCTEAGYTKRTYCEGCNSIVNFGEITPATGHTWQIVDGVRKCACGELFTGESEGVNYINGVPENGWVGDSYYENGTKYIGIKQVDGYYYDFGTDGVCAGKVKYTGLVDIEGVNYFSKFGELASGWYEIDDEWYYFVPETLAGADGSVKTTDGITFNFASGKVLDGVWQTTQYGRRYWYGSAYYKRTSINVPYLTVEIDGDTYLFDGSGYPIVNKYICTHASNDYVLVWYSCDANGAATRAYGPMIVETTYQNYTGKFFIDADGHSSANSVNVMKMGDDLYYVARDGQIRTSCTRFISTDEANGFVKPGKYDIDENGKIIIPEPFNGIKDGYYYVNGKVAGGAGLIKWEENYYYVSYTGQIVKNSARYVTDSDNHSDGEVKNGKYDFDADGKIVIPKPKNGVIDGYYYVNGKVAGGAGLIKWEGNYYYVSYTGQVVKNGARWVTDSDNHTNGAVKNGKYSFDAEGKIII